MSVVADATGATSFERVASGLRQRPHRERIPLEPFLDLGKAGGCEGRSPAQARGRVWGFAGITASTTGLLAGSVATANLACARPSQPPTSISIHVQEGSQTLVPPTRSQTCRVAAAGRRRGFAHATEPRPPARCSRKPCGLRTSICASAKATRRGRPARGPGQRVAPANPTTISKLPNLDAMLLQGIAHLAR